MSIASQVMPGRHEFKTLIEVDMDVGVFSSHWSQCDRLSSYIARMVSHNRTDSLLYSNLFSSALNELLETVFRTHRPTGRFACNVLRSGPTDRIEIVLPCGEDERAFYAEAIGALNEPDVSELYRTALFADGPLDPRIGLLELAADYAARLSVEQLPDGAVRLTADLALEDAAS